MTPQLQMAIKLLQLSKLELVDVIQQEMEKNPALEEVQILEGLRQEKPAPQAIIKMPGLPDILLNLKQ